MKEEILLTDIHRAIEKLDAFNEDAKALIAHFGHLHKHCIVDMAAANDHGGGGGGGRGGAGSNKGKRKSRDTKNNKNNKNNNKEEWQRRIKEMKEMKHDIKEMIYYAEKWGALDNSDPRNNGEVDTDSDMKTKADYYAKRRRNLLRMKRIMKAEKDREQEEKRKKAKAAKKKAKTKKKGDNDNDDSGGSESTEPESGSGTSRTDTDQSGAGNTSDEERILINAVEMEMQAKEKTYHCVFNDESDMVMQVEWYTGHMYDIYVVLYVYTLWQYNVFCTYI